MEQYVNLVFTFHNVSINSLSPSLHRRIPSPFTFHNVSINSFPETNIGKLHKNHLHSIMYLLILKLALKKEIRQSEFTFHNVSINSRPPATIISSIVFLLFLSTSFYSPHLTSIFLL